VIGAVEIFNESTELSAVRREISELRDLGCTGPSRNGSGSWSSDRESPPAGKTCR
jgi:hypothetical protein